MTEAQAKKVIELYEISRMTIKQIAHAPTVQCTVEGAQRVIDGELFPDLPRRPDLPHFRLGKAFGKVVQL